MYSIGCLCFLQCCSNGSGAVLVAGFWWGSRRAGSKVVESCSCSHFLCCFTLFSCTTVPAVQHTRGKGTGSTNSVPGRGQRPTCYLTGTCQHPKLLKNQAIVALHPSYPKQHPCVFCPSRSKETVTIGRIKMIRQACL